MPEQAVGGRKERSRSRITITARLTGPPVIFRSLRRGLRRRRSIGSLPAVIRSRPATGRSCCRYRSM